MKFHALADIFPLIEGADFDALCADIRAHGLRRKIVLYDGQILDGRNRFRACKETGTPADFEVYRGDDPLAFVLSLNLRRRHLNESQRALVAARLANLGVGRPNPANLQNISQPDAAKLLHVSARSVASAAQVIAHAQPKLLAQAERGVIAVSAAAQASKLQPSLQIDIAQRAAAGQANVVRTALKQGIRAQRERDLGKKQAALPDKKYGVIYADPEWRFETFSRETGLDRAADNHYPTSSTSDICARAVASIAAEDCVLFLWSTAPMQCEAHAVLAAWGFAYRAQFVWSKPRAGTGYWNRNRHEVLLVGVRGKPPAPAMGTQYDSVLDGPLASHSAKPEIFAEMIETYYPNLPKIELNRRGPARKGWDAWGNEAEDAA